MYLVGDIIDGWAMYKSFYWPQSHNDVIQKLLRRARKGTEVIYIPGNHDEFLRSFGDHELGNIILAESAIHDGVDGKLYMVMHGDQFDLVMQNAKWLAHLGTWAYDISIQINVVLTKIRKLFGLPYWSLSAWAKYKVKSAVNFIGDYEINLTNYARSKGVDGIICGHIHSMNMRKMDEILYINTGDWVESCTAIVEHADGRWEALQMGPDGVMVSVKEFK
jgi:UDP-2,3-diacylglucosamine pyrophosphatase LpxH